MEIKTIIDAIDAYLEKTEKTIIGPVEANVALEQLGILDDRAQRPGRPLRVLLREGLIPHAYQVLGKKTAWVIPHS